MQMNGASQQMLNSSTLPATKKYIIINMLVKTFGSAVYGVEAFLQLNEFLWFPVLHVNSVAGELLANVLPA
jgi:hypothetical protein